MRRFIIIGSLGLALLLAACSQPAGALAPTEAAPPVAMTEPPPAASEAPAATLPVLPTEPPATAVEATAPPTETPTTAAVAEPPPADAGCEYREDLHATDPGEVALASGKVQLVEFFAFW